jgi:trehalose 6-phosphate phosphatase
LQSVPIPVTPENFADHAFLFDLDGTLAPIAATPQQAHVPAATLALLDKLRQACSGAVAIVSGRSIQQIDDLLQPQRFPAAGLHGAQWRGPDGRLLQMEADTGAVAAMARLLRPLVDGHAGLQLEDKGLSLAVHYRNAPDMQAQVQAAAGAAMQPYGDAFTAQPGKMVIEIKPAQANKAGAIARLMQFAPFAGRKPVFAGDDLTDEAGFNAVRGMGGVSIKIGEGATVADWRFPTPEALAQWLALLC